MGKASRARSARQAVAQLKKEQESALAVQKKKKKIINICTAIGCTVLAAVFVLSLVLINIGQNTGYFLRRQNGMSSKNISINGATFTYFLNSQYQTFINNNASNLASYGIDATVSPREQELSDGTNLFDYIVDSTKNSITEVLVLAEKAKAEGLELDESDNAQIDDFFASLEKNAETNEQEVKDYISTVYGRGVTKEDIKTGLELSLLATKYYQNYVNGLNYSEKDKEEYFEQNKNQFLSVDYKYYTFVPEVSADMTDDQKTEAITKSKSEADRLSKAKTPEEYDNILSEILKNDGKTEEQINNAIDGTVLSDNSYDEDFSVSKWAFSDEATLYGVQLYTNGNSTSVYMLTKLPYKNEDETRSVRHILITAEEGKEDEAKEKAEEILAEYNKGEKTASAFGELATKYSSDTGSVATGGLYSNFSKGEMVEEFENWSFDETRKAGDTGIVKTTYGYHIMYFVGEGEPVWKTELLTSMQSEDYQAHLSSLKEEYPVTLNEKILSDIPLISFKKSEDTASA